MNPECHKCGSTSTRRRARSQSLTHRIMYFFGQFPWECMDCQQHFFNSQRKSRAKRHPAGEVYIETRPSRTPKSDAEKIKSS